MSASLLKKSLDLVDTAYTSTSRNVKGRDEAESKKEVTLVKIKNKKTGGKKTQRGAGDVARRHFKTIEQIKRGIRAEEEVKKNNRRVRRQLSKRVISDQLAQVLLSRLTKCEFEKKTPDNKEDEGTLFTEEDFARFEREYTG